MHSAPPASGRRLVSIAVVVAAVAVAAVAVAAPPVAAAAVTAAPPTTPAPTTPAVVARHAPLVWLHSEERFWPADATTFVARSELLWNRRPGCRRSVVASRGTIDPRRLGSGAGAHGGPYVERPTAPRVAGRRDACSRGGATRTAVQYTRPKLERDEGFALDLDDRRRRGTPPPCATARPRCDRYEGAPVYYEYEPRRYVTYWLFFAHSAPATGGSGSGRLIGHEGDWERIAVRLDRAERPVEVAYWQHNGDPTIDNRLIVPWSGLARTEGLVGNRPVAFSARGSHASYPAGCRRWLLVRLCVTDLRDRGWLWDAARDLRDVELEPWYGFGGAWGEVRSVFDTSLSGPDGPGPNGLNCRKPVVPRSWLTPKRCS